MQGTLRQPAAPDARPPRRWPLYLLHALWFGVAILVVESVLVTVRPAYVRLATICTTPPCADDLLTPLGAELLGDLGMTPQHYALFQVAAGLFAILLYAAIAVIIFRARASDPVAIFASMVLMLFGVFITNAPETMRTLNPFMEAVADLAPGITFICFAILCYIFPDGRFVPRWTRWAALLWVLSPVILIIGLFTDYEALIYDAVAVLLFILGGTCIIAPIIRYRTISSYRERQQSKWILIGLVQLVLMIIITVDVLPLVIPAVAVNGSLAALLNTLAQMISLAVLPLTFAISILRYRFWNVDLVINRTLVYVPLTSILTVIYTTSVAVSQRLFTSIAGEQPQAVAIFTTIILTTTFTPIKNTLQGMVDRYFKDTPDQLRAIKDLTKQVNQVVQALDVTHPARRAVETVVATQRAQGAALYLHDGQAMQLAYATPDWMWAEGEVSLLLQDDGRTVGRLLLGRRQDRDDYTWEELEAIRAALEPLARALYQLHCLRAPQGPLQDAHPAAQRQRML